MDVRDSEVGAGKGCFPLHICQATCIQCELPPPPWREEMRLHPSLGEKGQLPGSLPQLPSHPWSCRQPRALLPPSQLGAPEMIEIRVSYSSGEPVAAEETKQKGF